MLTSETEEKIITKQSIDQELLEKAMVDEKILSILDNVELILIIGLVILMIYMTYQRIVDYMRKKRKEQADLLEEQQNELIKNYNEKKESNLEE